jgi:hypothetical protein
VTYIPEYWYSTKLTAINLCQVAWWDETHRKCCIGDNINQLAHKNINCNIVNNNKPKINKLEGKRLPAIVYSNKVILSIRDWKKRELKEKSRIKNLAKNSYRCTTNRLNNSLYNNDTIDRIKDVGKLTAKKLNAANIILIEDLIDLTADQIKETSLLSTLTIKRINNILQYTRTNVIMTLDPPGIDYRRATDPYLAKFGEEGIMREIRKYVFLSGNVCITDTVQHIYRESELLFKGTIYKDDLWFWHDAFSLLTEKRHSFMDEREGELLTLAVA